MTTKKEKKGSAIDRVFKLAEQGKTMLNAVVLSSVLGYVCSIVPFLSVFFIAREFLLPGGGETSLKTIIPKAL